MGREDLDIIVGLCRLENVQDLYVFTSECSSALMGPGYGMGVICCGFVERAATGGRTLGRSRRNVVL